MSNKMQQIQDLFDDLRDEIYFSNGKYFDTKTKNEVRDVTSKIGNYLRMYHIPDVEENRNLIRTEFIGHNVDEPWPESSIVRRARQLGPVSHCTIADSLGLEDVKMLLAGVFLFDKYNERAIIIQGTSGTGKSTYMNILLQCMEVKNEGRCSLNDLSSDFKVAQALSSRVIYDFDLPANCQFESGVFKNICTHEPITVNGKYAIPYTATPQSKLIYSCNSLPLFDMSDTGIDRRMLVKSFERRPNKKDPDFLHREYTKQELVEFARNALYYYQGSEGSYFDRWFRKETHTMLIKSSYIYKLGTYDYDRYLDACRNAHVNPMNMFNWNRVRNMFEEWEEMDQLCLTDARR